MPDVLIELPRCFSIDELLQYFLKKPIKSKSPAELKIQDIAIKVFFEPGRYVRIGGMDGYILPQLYVVPNSPEVQRLFIEKLVARDDGKTYSYQFSNFEGQFLVNLQVHFHSTESDV